MPFQKSVTKWIRHGRQKRAVVQTLTGPMATAEIHAVIMSEDEPLAPHIRLRDISFLLREFISKGLVVCLTSEKIATGKIYALTEHGRKVAEEVFRIKIDPIPENADWDLYGWVTRSKNRKKVLIELDRLTEHDEGLAKSQAQIRKSLGETHPTHYEHIHRTFMELESRELVERVGVEGRQIFFRLTETGKKIAKIQQSLCSY